MILWTTMGNISNLTFGTSYALWRYQSIIHSLKLSSLIVEHSVGKQEEDPPKQHHACVHPLPLQITSIHKLIIKPLSLLVVLHQPSTQSAASASSTLARVIKASSALLKTDGFAQPDRGFPHWGQLPKQPTGWFQSYQEQPSQLQPPGVHTPPTASTTHPLWFGRG